MNRNFFSSPPLLCTVSELWELLLAVSDQDATAQSNFMLILFLKGVTEYNVGIYIVYNTGIKGNSMTLTRLLLELIATYCYASLLPVCFQTWSSHRPNLSLSRASGAWSLSSLNVCNYEFVFCWV